MPIKINHLSVAQIQYLVNISARTACKFLCKTFQNPKSAQFTFAPKWTTGKTLVKFH